MMSRTGMVCILKVLNRTQNEQHFCQKLNATCESDVGTVCIYAQTLPDRYVYSYNEISPNNSQNIHISI